LEFAAFERPTNTTKLRIETSFPTVAELQCEHSRLLLLLRYCCLLLFTGICIFAVDQQEIEIIIACLVFTP